MYMGLASPEAFAAFPRVVPIEGEVFEDVEAVRASSNVTARDTKTGNRHRPNNVKQCMCQWSVRESS